VNGFPAQTLPLRGHLPFPPCKNVFERTPDPPPPLTSPLPKFLSPTFLRYGQDSPGRTTFREPLSKEVLDREVEVDFPNILGFKDHFPVPRAPGVRGPPLPLPSARFFFLCGGPLSCFFFFFVLKTEFFAGHTSLFSDPLTREGGSFFRWVVGYSLLSRLSLPIMEEKIVFTAYRAPLRKLPF